MNLQPRDTALHDALREIHRRAGEAAIPWFGRATTRYKADGTEVSEADQAAEEAIVAAVDRLLPECGLVAEEGYRRPDTTGQGTLYADPLDGTSAFLDGLAHWGPTVALVRGGVTVAGGLYIPRTGEWWYAERGGGAWRDGVPLAPQPIRGHRTHDTLYLPSRFHRALPLDWPGKVRALGASAVHLALVASGGAAATLLPQWAPWDVLAGILMVEEVGRTVANVDGTPVDAIGRPGTWLVAGDAGVLPTLTDAVRRSLSVPRTP